MFSLIYVWINGWVNNREAGDLRRYRGHYDVIVMLLQRDPKLPVSDQLMAWQPWIGYGDIKLLNMVFDFPNQLVLSS